MLFPWKLAKLQVQITSLLFTHFHFDLMTFFRCQEETKNKSIVFLETESLPVLCSLYYLSVATCVLSPRARDLKPEDLLPAALILCDSIAQPSWRGQLSRLLPHLFLRRVQVTQGCTREHKSGKCYADALKLLKIYIIRSQGDCY